MRAGDQLKISLKGADGRVQEWTLSGKDGSHPAPDQAKAELKAFSDAGKDPFAPVPKDAICTMIHGGAQTATVSGSWEVRQVNASFNRLNGCEIARWDRVKHLLEPPAK